MLQYFAQQKLIVEETSDTPGTKLEGERRECANIAVAKVPEIVASIKPYAGVCVSGVCIKSYIKLSYIELYFEINSFSREERKRKRENFKLLE